MLVHPTNNSIIEQNELVFEPDILVDGYIASESLLETRLDVLVKEKKWRNSKAYILLPNDFVTVREESIPGQLSENDINDYLKLHMNQSIRMPFDNPVFQYTLIEETEETDVIHDKRVLLLAYPGESINQYKEILKKVSLKPEVADVTALSLYRVVKKRNPVHIEDTQHTMLLQWNPVDVSIMVFHQNRPMFNRHSQNDALLEAWNVSPEAKWVWTDTEVDLQMSIEDQLNSLERFLDFYRYSVLDGEESITEIILTGYYPNLDVLKEQISERFPVNVQLLELPKEIQQPFGALFGLTLRDEAEAKDRKKSKVKRGRKK